MANIIRIYIYSIATILLFGIGLVNKAYSNELILPKDPLMVTNVIIDKTDVNAVTARSKAIVEAKREAFRKLAQGIMPADVFMKYEIPKDNIINSLVKDFEIKEEKISKNRYLANFTFRFNKEAAYILRMAGGDLGSYNIKDMQKLGIKSSDRDFISWGDNKDISVLILPFYKNFFGRNILWEDPNPWRDAWQYFDKLKTPVGISLIIPSGDMSDIDIGDSDSIFQGNSDVLERLKEKYKVDKIVLFIADNKESAIDINIYNYVDSEFRYKKTLEPFAKSGDIKIDFWRLINYMVTKKDLFDGVFNFKNKKQYLKKIIPVNLELTMNFGSFKEWLDIQKMITSMKGNPTINISNISKGSVNFNIELKSEDAFKNLKEEFFRKELILIPEDSDYYRGEEDISIIKHHYILRLNKI